MAETAQIERKGRLFKFGVALAIAGAALSAASVTAYYLLLPDVSALALENPKTTAYIEHYVRRTRAKGKRPVIMMRWVGLAGISPYLRQAVVIAEDDSFYRHAAVDWDAIGKAMEYNRKKGRFLRGASTITQQVARNLYLSPERSVLRKLKEIAIAYKLERALTKDRILEIYLNIAEWGQGIYGAQAASEIYFGKNALGLNPEESAALAAALPSPWSRNPSLATQATPLSRKKDIILARMRKAGYLPPGVSEGEIDVPGTVEPPPGAPAPGSAAHAAAHAATESAFQPAPCDVPGSSESQAAGAAPSSKEPPDSCGPQTPALFSR